MRNRCFLLVLLVLALVASSCGVDEEAQPPKEFEESQNDSDNSGRPEASSIAERDEPERELAHGDDGGLVETLQQTLGGDLQSDDSNEAIEADVIEQPPSSASSVGQSIDDASDVCLSVSLGDQRLLNSSGLRLGRPVPIDLPDGQYEVTLVSVDELHSAGDQSSQPGEQWVLEFLDTAGRIVGETRPIGDLGDADLILTESVGSYSVMGVVAVRARHQGIGGVNSVVAARAFLSGANCLLGERGGETAVAVCVAVPLGNQRLLNSSGGRLGSRVEVRLPDGRYEVTLSSADQLHGSADQPRQDNEQWVLEFLNADGVVLAETRPISDLADTDLNLEESVGVYYIAGVVAVRARHLGIGGVNSIVPIQATFSSPRCPDLLEPPEGEEPSPPGGDEGTTDPPDSPGEPDDVLARLTAALDCDQVLAVVQDQIRLNPADYFFEPDGSEPQWHEAFANRYTELSCEVVPL